MLEVIAVDIADAVAAEQAGADRLELVSSMSEGGLTPSYGLIKSVVERVSIPVHVMIRPHSKSFCYDEGDLEVMLADIRATRELGAAGIVIGLLDQEGQIAREPLEALLAEAGDLAVTFHRAFDQSADRLRALDTLLQLPKISRLLTSAGRPSVLEPDATLEITEYVQRCKGSGLTILAGSGLTVDSIPHFVEQTGVQEIHFGSGVRYDRSFTKPIDQKQIRDLQAMLATAKA